MRKISLASMVLIVASTLLFNHVGVSQTKKITLTHGKSWITSVHFTPDGKRVISASFDGTVMVWDAKSGNRIWKFDLDGKRAKDKHSISNIGAMVISSDGNLIAVSYDQSTVINNTLQSDSVYRIALVDAKSGALVRTLIGHTFLTNGLDFSPDGKCLLSSSGDNTARIWDVKSGIEKFQISLKEQGAIPIFTPDGKYFLLATAPVDNVLPVPPIIGMYGVESGKLIREIPRTDYRVVSGMTVSPDGKYLVVGGFNMPNVTTKVWDLSLPNSQEPRAILADNQKLTGNYVFSQDGRFLAFSESNNGEPAVSVLDFLSDKIVKTYKTSAEVRSLDLSVSGSQLVVGTEHGRIILLPFILN